MTIFNELTYQATAALQRLQEYPSVSTLYELQVRSQDADGSVGHSLVVAPPPAGYTVSRSWEVIDADNILGGPFVGQIGIGSPTFNFDIANVPFSTSRLRVHIYDQVNAGPLGGVYEPTIATLTPGAGSTIDPLVVNPIDAFGEINFYTAGCGPSASLITSQGATVQGVFTGSTGAANAYSETIWEVAPAVTGPWSAADMASTPFSPADPVVLTGLAPETTYFYRFRIRSTAPNANPGTTLFLSTSCGSFTTAAPLLECGGGVQRVHARQATLWVTAHEMPPTEFFRLVLALSPTGPWDFYVGSNHAGNGLDPQITSHTPAHPTLTPETTYYPAWQHLEADGVTVRYQIECPSFTTRAADDENYLGCSTNPPTTLGRDRGIFPVDYAQDDLPAPVAQDSLLIEHRVIGTLPWTLADLFLDNAHLIPVPNPMTTPGGGFAQRVGNLEHNNDYEVRLTLFDLNDVQVDQIVCPAFTTANRPNPPCGTVSDITFNSASIRFAVIGAGGIQQGEPPLNNLPSFMAGDTATVEVSTTNFGPWVVAGTFGPVPANQVLSSVLVPLTGLAEHTQYFYRLRLSEDNEEATGQYYAGPTCALPFTTLDNPATQPNYVTTKVTDPATPLNAPVAIGSVVTVLNDGTDSGSTVISDQVPAPPPGTLRTFTSVATGGATGNTVSGNGAIYDTVFMPIGSTVEYTITDTVSNPGVYENFVTVGIGPPISGGRRVINLSPVPPGASGRRC